MDNEHDVHSLVEGNIDHILDRFMSMSYLLQVPWDRQKCLKTTDQTIMLNERVHIWSLDYMQDQFKPSIFKSTGWFGLLAQELIVKCWGEVSSAPNFGGPFHQKKKLWWPIYFTYTELHVKCVYWSNRVAAGIKRTLCMNIHVKCCRNEMVRGQG